MDTNQTMVSSSLSRCEWVTNDLLETYHDTEWGIPVHDDRILFEMLCLEGAQAGLSWLTVLQKREAYRNLFCNFDAHKIIHLGDETLESYLLDARIIRNRLKVFGFRKNANAYVKVLNEFSSFDKYIWQFVDYTSIVNEVQTMQEMLVTSKESDAMSKDLKKRNFTFVGSTICYAYMQAVGMTIDHTKNCWKTNNN